MAPRNTQSTSAASTSTRAKRRSSSPTVLPVMDLKSGKGKGGNSGGKGGAGKGGSGGKGGGGNGRGPSARGSGPIVPIQALTHKEANRKNIPSAEHQSLHQDLPLPPLRYPRHTAADPQLVWRGKDEQDSNDLQVPLQPLYIQEKVHPKVLLDNLVQDMKSADVDNESWVQRELFGDFNGMPEGVDRTEFYQHDQHWTNRMILGDSLQVMASLAEREGLRGKVQCIYLDPPYGIKFNSNFQWSTTSRDVKDGNADHITREPEQVKAFRDTWRDGIHSYLTYLRDRLMVARDLLTDSGSIFVQIGDENVHRVRMLMDEIFGEENFVSQISFNKNSGLAASLLPTANDHIIWHGKRRDSLKFRGLKELKQPNSEAEGLGRYTSGAHPDGRVLPLSKVPEGSQEWKICTYSDLTKPGPGSRYIVEFEGQRFNSGQRWWGMPPDSMARAIRSGRIKQTGKSVSFVRWLADSPTFPINNTWNNIGGVMSRSDPKIYVVQTSTAAIQRCILMATDPGDLVLDPTCGSGTTAYVAEQWGRRWITIDTSRVALALARSRIMGARYPYYLLADSREGQHKEAEVTRSAPSNLPTGNRLSHGFVYERVPHITLKSIANNAEIDVIWENWQRTLEPLRDKLNKATKQAWHEWEIPREADTKWNATTKQLHADWWKARIARQKEIDASIAAKAEFELLYDKPYEAKHVVRVAGPFTVESLSPHRAVAVDEHGKPVDLENRAARQHGAASFAETTLATLQKSGVQQANKSDKLSFTSVQAWPGNLVCGEGRYQEGTKSKRAAIFIGPEFGTVVRKDLEAAAKEAMDGSFDILVACAFAYEAHTTEVSKVGRLPVLKARMNADLHMAEDLKNTGKGNLFVVFGEPDIELNKVAGGKFTVTINGVDIYDPNKDEVRSDNADGIACWFIDTNYNNESFFVRHAYFLGANDPYKSLKTSLKSEIDEDAWASLNSATSRPFAKPKSGLIAVKVINHLGDEVMKICKVP